MFIHSKVIKLLLFNISSYNESNELYFNIYDYWIANKWMQFKCFKKIFTYWFLISHYILIVSFPLTLFIKKIDMFFILRNKEFILKNTFFILKDTERYGILTNSVSHKF